MGIVGERAGQIGVVEGHKAAVTSMDETYYHFNNMYYKLPVDAIIMRNSENVFTGYQTSTGEQIMLSQMSGLDQTQFGALHIGKYEGVQAAMTSMHDSIKENHVGVNMGQAAAHVSMHDSMIHNQTGVVEGHNAAVTSMVDTHVQYNGQVYSLPEGSIVQYNAEHVFTGYQINGETISAADMETMTQTHSYDDATHIGQYEGAKAAQVSTSQNHIGVVAGQVGVSAGHIGQVAGNIGVKEGQAAATTSIDDTYLHYGNSYYRIPVGAIVQYGTNNILTGYQTSTGELVTVSNMTALTQSQEMATHIGQYEGAKAAQISTSINNIGVKEGAAAATTSMDDTYVHYGGHIYKIPAGAIE